MRSTDSDWASIGESEPYFGVLSGERFLLQNLTKEARNEFFLSGEHEIAGILARMNRLFGTTIRPAHAIDFGCGVGRLALAMANRARIVTGIDIAPGMLAEASENARRQCVTNVRFLEGAFPDEPADWVNSFLVFQHIVPERGFALLRQLLACLQPGGLTSIHLTAFRTNPHLLPSLDDVRWSRFDGQSLEVVASAELSKGAIRMYDYDMTRVLETFVSAGIGNLFFDHIDHDGHHAFRVYGRKSM